MQINTDEAWPFVKSLQIYKKKSFAIQPVLTAIRHDMIIGKTQLLEKNDSSTEICALKKIPLIASVGVHKSEEEVPDRGLTDFQKYKKVEFL